jgi:hypothetical protein
MDRGPDAERQKGKIKMKKKNIRTKAGHKNTESHVASGRLNFVWWRLVFVGLLYGTCFMSPFCRKDFCKIWRGVERRACKLRHYPCTCLEGLSKTPKTWVRIVGVLVEIRTGKLPNTRQKRYSLTITEWISVACTMTSISHNCPSTLYHHTLSILPLYSCFALR